MPPHTTAVALRRFGLGPRPGDTKAIAGDPRGFVLASLADPARALLVDQTLEPSHVTFEATRTAQKQQKMAKDAAKDAAQATPEAAPMASADLAAQPPMAPMAKAATPVPGDKPGRIRREAMLEEAAARFELARTTPHAFLERLVMFWSNHFCVSITKGQVRGLAGAFEREAIRPHVLGGFGAMLKAVEQHPAMLIYLDQAQSIGPNSKAGSRRDRGLNENLAREILELHTLGVDGGYGQEDVTNLARILTGWGIGGLQQDDDGVGRFRFTPQRHEPGAWTVAGKRYEDRGVATGEACLADLARHPSTAKHIARKFAVHFISDNPPPALVDKLERSFRETDGDLGQLAKALATAPEAWSAPFTKVLPPYDFSVALARGLGIAAPPGEMLRLAAALGQPLWQPPGPKGWPDADDSWLGPSPIRERLRIAEKASSHTAKSADPRELAADLFGEHLSEPTAQAVKRAETREQGMVLLVMSPEFQRR